MKNLPKCLDPTSSLKGCFIAGGAVLSAATKTEIADYDIYPKTNDDMITVFHYLMEDNCFVVNITDRAVTFKSNNIINKNGERGIIQVMTYDTFETAEKIFSNFDFTVCMGAFDCDTKQYIFHEDFYPDIAAKALRFNTGTKYPLNSLLRVSKYQAKGYFISKPEMIKIALTVIQYGMPTSWDDLEAAIGGSYGREIKLNVKENQEFSFDAAIELLSNIQSIDHYYRNIDEFSGTTADDLEDMFSEEEKLIIINSNGDSFLIDKETMLPCKHVGHTKPRNYKLLNEDKDFRMIGYKLLLDNKNGTYSPGIYSYKKVLYTKVAETVEHAPPHLYVFPKKKQADDRLTSSGNKKVFEVSFNACDVMFASKTEIQVKKLMLEDETSLDTKVENDL